jgi:hypothetical protein
MLHYPRVPRPDPEATLLHVLLHFDNEDSTFNWNLFMPCSFRASISIRIELATIIAMPCRPDYSVSSGPAHYLYSRLALCLCQQSPLFHLVVLIYIPMPFFVALWCSWAKLSQLDI